MRRGFTSARRVFTLHRIAALFLITTLRPPRPLGHFLDENRTAAIGTSDRQRLVPRGEFAFGIFVTAIEDLAPTRFAFFDVAFLALRTLDAEVHPVFQRLNIFSLVIAAPAL